ncbi:MAG: hypothetical protein IJG94_06280 [Clostridia bacterium]|nr:hypothetical protein [Clostridia bacterium]
MKKLVAILMALILSLSVAASLAEIVNPLSPLIDVNRLEGRFVLASVRSAGNGRIEFTLYEAERYAKADLEKLKKGDILVSDGQEVTVQTVSLVNETCTVNAGLEDEVLLQANEFGEYLISLDDDFHPLINLGTFTQEVNEYIPFLDNVDPATGEMRELPTVASGKDFIDNLDSDPIGFDRDNTYLLFGASNYIHMIVRYYSVTQ